MCLVKVANKMPDLDANLEIHLRAELGKLAEQVRARSSDRTFSYYELDTGHLSTLLASTPYFAEFTGNYIRSVGGQEVPLSTRGLMNWLMSRAAAIGVDGTLAEFAQYHERPTFRFRFRLILAYLTVETAVDLGCGMRLVPSNKAAVGFAMDNEWKVDHISAELQYDFDHRKFHRAPAEPPDDRAVRYVSRIRERMRQARLCLGLVRPSYVEAMGETTEALDPLPGGSSGGGGLSFRLTAGPLVCFTPRECQEAADLHRAFRRLAPGVKRRLDIPLRRLQSAVLESEKHVDSAIDTTISLESLLLTSRDTDLSYRFALFGAWLLGKTSQSRRDIFDALKALYKLRSTVVHGGEEPTHIEDSGNMPIGDFVAKARELAASAIKEVIARRGTLDWKRIVLN